MTQAAAQFAASLASKPPGVGPGTFGKEAAPVHTPTPNPRTVVPSHSDANARRVVCHLSSGTVDEVMIGSSIEQRTGKTIHRYASGSHEALLREELEVRTTLGNVPHVMYMHAHALCMCMPLMSLSYIPDDFPMSAHQA